MIKNNSHQLFGIIVVFFFNLSIYGQEGVTETIDFVQDEIRLSNRIYNKDYFVHFYDSKTATYVKDSVVAVKSDVLISNIKEAYSVVRITLEFKDFWKYNSKELSHEYWVVIYENQVYRLFGFIFSDIHNIGIIGGIIAKDLKKHKIITHKTYRSLVKPIQKKTPLLHVNIFKLIGLHKQTIILSSDSGSITPSR